MPIACEIEFENNPKKVVYSDQILRGIVHLTKRTDEKIIPKACINIVGEGYVRWTDYVQKRRFNYSQNKYVTEFQTELRQNEETYLDVTKDLIGEVRYGTFHYYPFEYEFPPNLPTSFDSDYGHIRYKVCVIVGDDEFETPFTFIKAANNSKLDPKLREPVVIEKKIEVDRSSFLSCCRKAEPLEIIARTSASSYAPGQTIHIDIMVSNKSDRAVSQFTTALIKNVTYYADEYEKHEENVVVEKTNRGRWVNQDATVDVNFDVPSTPPTEESDSNVIKIQYHIRITASVDGIHQDPILVIPISIEISPKNTQRHKAPFLSVPIETSYDV